MSELKTVEDVVEAVIDCYTPYDGGTLNWKEAEKVITQDRADIARVLKARVEGLKIDIKSKDDYGSGDYMDIGRNITLEKILKIIEETLTPQTPDQS